MKLPLAVLLLSALLIMVPGIALSIPVTIRASGEYTITSITSGGLFSGFILDEPVDVFFTIDDATSFGIDDDYDDPSGFYEILGLTSGSLVTTNNGVSLEIDDSREIEIDNGPGPSTGIGVIDIGGDFDYDSATVELFSDKTDLSVVLSDIIGTFTFESDSHSAEVTLGDGSSSVVQAEFTFDQGGDPLTTTFSLVEPAHTAPGDPIPEPSTLVLFGVGILGVLGYGYRRKRSLRV